MKSINSKFCIFLNNQNYFALIIFYSVLDLAFNYSSVKIVAFFFSKETIDNPLVIELSTIEKLVAIPIFETLLFTSLIMELTLFLLKKFKYVKLVAAITSAVLFSWSHSFSTAYIIITLISGFLFSIAYLSVRSRKTGFFKATFLVISIHVINNVAVFLEEL